MATLEDLKKDYSKLFPTAPVPVAKVEETKPILVSLKSSYEKIFQPTKVEVPFYEGQIGEWMKPLQPETGYSGLWKPGYIPVSIGKPIVTEPKKSLLEIAKEKVGKYWKVLTTPGIEYTDPETFIEFADDYETAIAPTIRTMWPIRIPITIAEKITGHKLFATYEELSQKHPIATVVGSLVGEIYNLVALQALIGGGIEKAIKIPGPIKLWLPTLSRYIPSAIQTGATWGLKGILDESISQFEKGSFAPEKIATEGGKEFLFGTLLAAPFAFKSVPIQILGSGAIRAGWTTTEEYLRDGKIDQNDLLNIGANSILAMVFAAIGAKGRVAQIQQQETYNLAHEKLVVKVGEKVAMMIEQSTLATQLAQMYPDKSMGEIMEMVKLLPKGTVDLKLPIVIEQQIKTQIPKEFQDFKLLSEAEQSKILNQSLETAKDLISKGEPIWSSILKGLQSVILPKIEIPAKEIPKPAPEVAPVKPEAIKKAIPAEKRVEIPEVIIPKKGEIVQIKSKDTGKTESVEFVSQRDDGIIAKREGVDFPMLFKDTKWEIAKEVKPEIKPIVEKITYEGKPIKITVDKLENSYRFNISYDKSFGVKDLSKEVPISELQAQADKQGLKIETAITQRASSLAHEGTEVKPEVKPEIPKTIPEKWRENINWIKENRVRIDIPTEKIMPISERNKLIQEALDAGFKDISIHPKQKFIALIATIPEVRPIEKAEKELAGEVEKRIGEIIPPAGLGIKRVYKPPISDKIEGMKFSNPEIESRYKQSKGINTKGYYLKKVKEFIANFYHRATRTYPDLPNKPEFAELRNILSKQKNVKMVAQDRTARILQGITADIGPNKLDLLTRKIVLDDLIQEAKANRPLPLGYSEFDESGKLIIKQDLLNADKEKIDKLVFANPDIAEALTRRNKIWKAITDELVKYNILKEEQVKEDYFRHQILEYVNAKTRITKGVGPALKQRKPGYAKKRMGSTYDINTDYLEAEFEVMSQALHDIEIAKLLEQVEKLPINIKSELLKEAKEKGVEDWHTLIPEGYTVWQPKDGRVFYSAYTVPEKIVNQFVDDIGKGVLKLDQDLINKALAVGGKRKELVLPEGAAKTLDNLWIAKQPNWIIDSTKRLTTLWKKWVLFNPRRVIKYNWQNFLGDSDAVLAGNPAAFKKLPQSVKELYGVFAENAPMPDKMRDFFERGGFSSMLTIQEIPDIQNIKIFERFYANSQKAKTILQKINIFSRYWRTVIKFTQFRESGLRYAAYLDYIERFESGKNLNYGASNRTEIDALSNPKDKAAKVATDLIGNYADITALGKDLRESVIPFYSWNEINLRRYPAILRNAWQEGFGKGATTQVRTMGIATVKGGWALFQVLLRIVALTGVVMLYNQLFHGDAEQDLSEYDRGRMHINLGYDKNGEVRILRGQGAFSDALEWFGLEESPILWREYFEGKSSLTDIFGKIPFITGKVGLKPLMEKILSSISPIYKIPTEFISGYTWPFQDLKGYPIEDKWRQIFKNVQLENEYDWIFEKPSRGYLKSWGMAVITETDPLENAYRYIQSEKYRYLASKGKGGSSNYYTPRSIVYRAYKKALVYNDKEAETKAWEEMKKLGVKPSDLRQSLEWADPLSGLSKKEEKEFVNEYLSQSDRVKLEKAKTYYKKVFLSR